MFLSKWKWHSMLMQFGLFNLFYFIFLHKMQLYKYATNTSFNVSRSFYPLYLTNIGALYKLDVCCFIFILIGHEVLLTFHLNLTPNYWARKKMMERQLLFVFLDVGVSLELEITQNVFETETWFSAKLEVKCYGYRFGQLQLQSGKKTKEGKFFLSTRVCV